MHGTGSIYKKNREAVRRHLEERGESPNDYGARRMAMEALASDLHLFEKYSAIEHSESADQALRRLFGNNLDRESAKKIATGIRFALHNLQRK